MWPWNASTAGTVYLFHFNAPLGNLSNPRAQAQHYFGFCEDFDARIAKQLAGKGAKIVAAALKEGLVFEIYHWPACLATEKLSRRPRRRRCIARPAARERAARCARCRRSMRSSWSYHSTMRSCRPSSSAAWTGWK
jgi:hypothetical protein